MKHPSARVYVPVLAAIVGAGALVGVAVSGDDPHGSPGRHRGADGALTIDAAHRPTAPDLTGTDTDGHPASLADHRGKTVVVNVWASWCGPCREEAPALSRFHESTRGQGVVVLGLNEDDSAGAARDFAREFHLSYPSVLDPGGKRFRAVAEGVTTTQGLPATFVIDPRGRVAAAVSGPVDEKRLTALVAAARTGTGPSQPWSAADQLDDVTARTAGADGVQKRSDRFRGNNPESRSSRPESRSSRSGNPCRGSYPKNAVYFPCPVVHIDSQ
ncbi:TlpA family protein disulfide reductase [Streptomyces antibioticus]|uniref:TlpA family protein disulfide reductase n=1 Tax=Streptomyces antibioticus TaxID=1890 RepID=UPI0033D8EDED